MTQPSPSFAGAIPATSPTVTRPPRLESVDLLRGIVMVLMLLDHTRDFTHWGAFRYDPLDLARTTAPIFFTRWITHFCAPIFVFLAGTGAYFQLKRGKSKRELSSFLVKRGLWLIVLELTIVKFAFTFGFEWIFPIQVIWVLGVSMIALAALLHLDARVIAGFGLALILLHNSFDTIKFTPWQGPGTAIPSALGKLWIVLHQGGAFPVAGWPSPVIFALYPLIPWIGVMAVGYVFARLYDLDAIRRRRILVRLGLALTAAFVLIRATNLYGDPSDWSSQPTAVASLLSFLNTTKYPPSLLFLLMTLGPGFVALAWFERLKPARLWSALVTFGRVPLFFYLLQWFTAHILGIVAHAAAGKPWTFLFPYNFIAPPPDEAGFPLWVTYVVWLVGVALLYPVCRWFAGVKARRRDWWLSYM